MIPADTPVPTPVDPLAIASACVPVMELPSATAVLVPISAVSPPISARGETAPSPPISVISTADVPATSAESPAIISGANRPPDPTIATALTPTNTGTSHDGVSPLPRVSSFGSSIFFGDLPKLTS